MTTKQAQYGASFQDLQELSREMDARIAPFLADVYESDRFLSADRKAELEGARDAIWGVLNDAEEFFGQPVTERGKKTKKK